ncbi:hypothetical protein ASE06_02765 [Sphingopyxis sp. Root214]|uniref:hypothetical protein n=1 Tax=unclassified Sphingopyxis TaxID=2614943 RepID=UPI0006F3F2F4|nr:MULTISPECIES: hypothetical protein [unclassified Sphingopyxis]KQZ77245.1 hypothetical protein ASD73_05225 [Sphingopyxis sp. Root154]KRC08868.1 hypothetical protein ASE06_02765 [Sphingopyxis sp. Root214]
MLRSLAFTTSLALLLPAGAVLAETPKAAPAHKADLADRVAGTYKGDVISDARGSSKDGVTITVTRIGPNKVEIKSDYPRIPSVTIPLEKAMDAILAASGPSVFLLDTVRSPDRLDLTIDDASWSGNRVATPAKK